MFFKVFSPDCISAGQRKNKLTNRSKSSTSDVSYRGEEPYCFSISNFVSQYSVFFASQDHRNVFRYLFSNSCFLLFLLV